ncbi:MAG: AMP-binding protein, partial [Ilumatobacteraceae bacterium]
MQTFLDPIERALSVAADREALVCDGRRLTFREFADRLQRLHAVLAQRGLRRGDRVAILSF